MSQVKLTIAYYSSTGTNHQMALAAAEAARQAGAEVRVRKFRETAPQAAVDSNPAWKAHLEATQDVPEMTLDDLDWADAFIVGTPTRFGNVASQVKAFLDTTGGLWYQRKLVNKVVSGFTSAQNPHGGQETTLMALYNTFYHWGTIIVPPGYSNDIVFASGGNPYGVSVTANGGPIPAEVLKAQEYMAQRVVQVASWVAEARQPAIQNN